MPHTAFKRYAPRVTYIYANSRRRLAEEVARGEAPDTTLHGQNHLGELGIDARMHEPLLTRRGWTGPLNRLAWDGRELTLPWELRDTDVAFSVLGRLFPLAARARPGLKTVILNFGLNTIYRRSRHARPLLRSALRSADAVVCLGASQREELIELVGVEPEDVHVSQGSVDAAYFVPQPPPDGSDPYVLAVGKDLARDYATLAEALRPLDVRSELLAHPRTLIGVELPPRTRVSEAYWGALRSFYAGAACVVVPQRRDNFLYGTEGGGLSAILEAMAMGRPLVVSERAILPDYVRPGETALVVPPEDPAALREAIERVLLDSSLAESLGRAARASVEFNLTTRHEARRLAPIFRAVAAR